MKQRINTGSASAIDRNPQPTAARLSGFGFIALGAVLCAGLLSGCASTEYQGGTNDDPYLYNPETGYPLVGGSRWSI